MRAPECGSQGSLQGLSAPQRIFPDPPGLPKFYSKHSALTVFFRPQVSKLSLPMIEEGRRAWGRLTSAPLFIIYRETATFTPCSERGPLRHLDHRRNIKLGIIEQRQLAHHAVACARSTTPRPERWTVPSPHWPKRPRGASGRRNGTSRRHVYKLLLEVPAPRQHVRVARSTLKAFNQEQSLTAVHGWPLLDLGRGTAAVPTAPDCCLLC
jgi:hypothetical protein